MDAVRSSTVPSGTPLGCLLENLKSLKLMPDLKASKLIYLCNKENPSQFLECLIKALLQHTNLNPENPEGKQLLMTYFFPSFYIKAKLM